jgi:addiction module HigA family antidote
MMQGRILYSPFFFWASEKHRAINTAFGLISNTEFASNGRTAMPAKSKSQTTTERTAGRRLPRHRPPTHPDEMLLEEFIKPLEITQTELARRLNVAYPRLNEIIRGRRSVTPNTALRLSQVLGMSADFWLGLQQDRDLWHAMNNPEAKDISRLKPISLAAGNITAQRSGQAASPPTL